MTDYERSALDEFSLDHPMAFWLLCVLGGFLIAAGLIWLIRAL